MAFIKYVRPSLAKGRVEMGVEDNSGVKRFCVSSVFYSHIGEPLAGEEISEELYSLVSSEDEGYRAMKKALSLLAYSDKSRSMLYSRLIGHGYSRDAASEAVKECMRLGYIKEKEQIARFVKREANVSLKGRLHIIRKAPSKGFKTDEVRKIVEELIESGEIDFEESFARLAEKKGAETEEEKAALRY